MIKLIELISAEVFLSQKRKEMRECSTEIINRCFFVKKSEWNEGKEISVKERSI